MVGEGEEEGEDSVIRRPSPLETSSHRVLRAQRRLSYDLPPKQKVKQVMGGYNVCYV